MILNQNIHHGICCEKGEITNFIESGEYYDKYIFENEDKDKFLLYIKNDSLLEENCVIILTGTLELPSVQRNRGGFDNSKYMYSQNLYGSIFVDSSNNIEIFETKRFNLITFIQNNIYETLAKFLPKEHLGILLGMIIGDTSYISEDVEESFRLSGITHLLAVSGSNVTYIILVVKFLFNKLVGKSFSNYITIIMIIMFVLISGASPSVVRAGVMAIILILSEILSYSSNTISTVATTAIIILVYNPLIICDVGFILSFGGTLGILFLNKSISEWFCKKFYYFSKKQIFKSMVEMLSVTLSAQVILTPVMMYYFNNISFVSIFTNLLVGPFTGMITVLGLIIYFLSLFYIPLGKFLSYSIYILISLVIWIAQFCSKVPYGNITVTTPSLLFVMIYYLVIYWIYSKNVLKNKRSILKRRLLKMLISVLIIIQILSVIIPKNYIEVNFVDVGQGDCTLIKTNHYNILIDGGGSENSNYDVGEQVLVPYLLDNTNGIIDILFISHFHEDHAEGCISVLENLKVKKIIIGTQPVQTELYLQVLKISKEKNIPIISLSCGDNITIDEISFKILYPNKELEILEDLNNNSLVLRMDYYNTSLLFTGDIEKEAENILVTKKEIFKNNNILSYENEEENMLDIDILKVAHHGSKTSSTLYFLKETTPKVAIVSLGEKNKFGHPHKEVIERFKEINCDIYRTDECGEITLKIYKDNKIKVTKNINI